MPAVTTVEENISPLSSGTFFRVYPNPTTGDFTLEFQDNAPVTDCHVEILNMTGSQKFSADLTGSGKHSLSLTGMPSGLYIVKVVSGQRAGTVKMIRQP